MLPGWKAQSLDRGLRCWLLGFMRDVLLLHVYEFPREMELKGPCWFVLSMVD